MCIRDSCRDSLVLEMETPQVKLSFANTVEQFDTGDGGSCAIKVLEAKHRSRSGFNTAVILLDQIVQVLRRSQLGVLPCLVFLWHLPNCSVRCSVAIQGDTDPVSYTHLDVYKRQPIPFPPIWTFRFILLAFHPRPCLLYTSRCV